MLRRASTVIAIFTCLIVTGYFMIEVDQIKFLQNFAPTRPDSKLQATNKQFVNFNEILRNYKALMNSETNNASTLTLRLGASSNKTTNDDDYFKLIPLKPKTKYLIAIDGVKLQCEGDNECVFSKVISWKMFTFVKSAAANIQKRNFIRYSWGSLKYVNGGQFSTIFIVGRASGAVQNLIEEEAARFNDILQIDELDDYMHVGLKTLAGMQWSSEHLEDNDFYSSCDDDMLVKLDGVQEYIDRYIGERLEMKWPEFPIICSYEARNEKDDPPLREIGHKNFVSEKQYKWPQWPKFCTGGMYTTSVSVARQLFEISRTQPSLLNTDDVWITGVLRNILGLPATMLINPKPSVANHLGYLKNKKISHMRWLWNNAFKEMESKTICRC